MITCIIMYHCVLLWCNQSTVEGRLSAPLGPLGVELSPGGSDGAFVRIRERPHIHLKHAHLSYFHRFLFSLAVPRELETHQFPNMTLWGHMFTLPCCHNLVHHLNGALGEGEMSKYSCLSFQFSANRHFG